MKARLIGISLVRSPKGYWNRRHKVDSLDWSRKYEVLSVSRLDLSSLGFTNAEVNAFTDEDMEKLADSLAQGLHSMFRVATIHTAKLVMSEQNNHIGGTNGEDREQL